MNILQHLPEAKHGQVLVTLNPPFPVDPTKTIAKFKYAHPMMTTTSVATQSLIPSIQNTRKISYVGAWTKYGFHEDGFASAFKLVTSEPFSVKPPFPLKPASRVITEPTFLERFGRALIVALDGTRRRAEAVGVGIWLSWVMGMILAWLERGMDVVKYESGRKEVRRIRGYWVKVESEGQGQGQGHGKVQKQVKKDGKKRE